MGKHELKSILKNMKEEFKNFSIVGLFGAQNTEVGHSQMHNKYGF